MYHTHSRPDTTAVAPLPSSRVASRREHFTGRGPRSALSLVRGVGAVAGYRQYRLDAQPSTCFAGTVP